MKISLKTNVTGSTKRWGQLFAILLLGGTLFTWIGAAIWLHNDGRLPTDILLALLLMIPIIPVSLMLLVPPMFFDGYPAWIVNIFGEKFLIEMVQGLFASRRLANPPTKLTSANALDALLKQRFGLAALIVLALVAGLLSAFL
jgi:hypothetical protein